MQPEILNNLILQSSLGADNFNHLFIQAWWVLCTALVLLMIFGFTLLESGLVDGRHMSGIAVKNVCIFFISSAVYSLFGFDLMYTQTVCFLDGSFCGIFGNMSSYPDSKLFEKAAYFESSAFQLYQTGFAAVAATIISGAIAGRTTLLYNVLAAALIAGVIYPIFGHWIWNPQGIFSKDNVDAFFKIHDYAGASVVHLLGGTAALVACFHAGPRQTKDVQEGDPLKEEDDPLWSPSPEIAAGGVLLLLIGWIGFNGGNVYLAQEMIEFGEIDSILNDDSKAVIIPIFNPGKYALYTVLAAFSGAISAFVVSSFVGYCKDKSYYLFDPYPTFTGSLSGMVAITACCDSVTKSQALLVGVFAGLFSFFIRTQMIRKSNIYDPVDAVAVHTGGAVVGLLFAGFLESDMVVQLQVNLWSQLGGIFVCITFTAIVMYFFTILAKALDVMIADTDLQILGLRYQREMKGKGGKPVDYASRNRMAAPVILIFGFVCVAIIIYYAIDNQLAMNTFQVLNFFLTVIALYVAYRANESNNGTNGKK
ncbi:MAG: hypothetical protein V3T17_18910 [Pseudomonadales bacterium]